MRLELRRTSSMLVQMKSVLIDRELNKIPKTQQENFKELNNLKKPDLTMFVLSKEHNSTSLQRT